jgi:transcriptional regulator of acetoin/glycerol metabolism
LVAYHWPGNVREMSHIIERGVLLSENEKLSIDDLHISQQKQALATDINKFPFMTLQQAEVSLITQALEQTKNHIPKAASLLGLTKASMYRRLEKYGITKG